MGIGPQYWQGPKNMEFVTQKGNKYCVYYIYIYIMFICGKFCTGHSMWTKIHGNYAIYFYLYLRLLHEKNQKILRMNVFQSHWTIEIDCDAHWRNGKNRHVLSLSWDKSRRIFRGLDVDISICSGCIVWQNKEGHLTGNQCKSAYFNIAGHQLNCYDESEYHLASFFDFFE